MSVLLIFSCIVQLAVCIYDRRVITTINYSRNKVAPTIVNGSPVESSQVPYLVSLKQPIYEFSGKIVWKNVCGGSIIDAKRVLTAAHCFETDNFYFARNPHILRYVAGNTGNSIEHSGATESTAKGQWRRLSKVRLHKAFVFPMNDIAIVLVDKPWIFTQDVHPIKLAKKSMDRARHCTAAGYGRVGPSLRDAISPVLLLAPISVLPKWQCSMFWEMNMNKFICSNTAVTDVARGDSGGPLVCNGTDDPEEKTGDVVLEGVVSGKNVDKTSLYTRVSSYHDWINNEANKLYGNVCLPIIMFVVIYLWFYYAFIYRHIWGHLKHGHLISK